MKDKIQKIEDTLDDIAKHQTRQDDGIKGLNDEIKSLREFKHTTNGTLHSHNGKLDVIVTQQNNAADAITKLTGVVQDAVKKLNAIMTIKWMLMGAGIVLVPTVTGMVYLFKWYLESKGYK